MESPSPTDRRQAWVRSSHQWVTLEETEPQGSHTPVRRASHDSAVPEGCAKGKIESWLQDWGPEEGSDVHQSLEPSVKPGASFEDDLSLGAEALAFSIQDDGPEIGICPLLLPPPRPRNKGQATSTPSQKLAPPLSHLGHSTASSGLSSSTSRTASSVLDILQLCEEDAEDILYQLGFGYDEPQVTGRIPARFFSFPSQLNGINFRLFLESQLGRLHQEDPGLSLASRFRQVEVLTATANAFYSLYSHVSRTPLQKLAPPEMSFSQSPVETWMGPRFFNNFRNEPRSPVERLKDTVSKMCLYTGSSLRSPEPTSPRKHAGLPDLVEDVMETVDDDATVAEVALESQYGGAVDEEDNLGNLKDSVKRGEEQETEVEQVDRYCREPRSRIAEVDVKKAEALSMCPPVRGEVPKNSQCTSGLVAKGLQPTRSLNVNTEKPSSPTHDDKVSQRIPLKRICQATKYTKDIICPQILENVRQVPFSNIQRKEGVAAIFVAPPEEDPRLPAEGQDRLREEMHRGENTEDPLSEFRAVDKECCLGDVQPDNSSHVASTPPPHSGPAGLWSSCRITVTGSEGDTMSLTPAITSLSPDTREVRATPDPESPGSRRFMNPEGMITVGQTPHSLPQANSFELEEVNSAGEDDPTQSESRHSSFFLSAVNQHGDFLLRGDSLQSDSSGYVEEDHPRPITPEQDGGPQTSGSLHPPFSGKWGSQE